MELSLGCYLLITALLCPNVQLQRVYREISSPYLRNNNYQILEPIKADLDENGYFYPKPKVPFEDSGSFSPDNGYYYLRPKNPFESTTVVPPSYLPPSMTSSPSPPQPPKLSSGYDYPTPKIPFTFPPKINIETLKPSPLPTRPPKIFTNSPSTYIPPVNTQRTPLPSSLSTSQSSGYYYSSPIIQSTFKPTFTNPKPSFPQVTISTKVTGYDYPTPKVAFTLPPRPYVPPVIINNPATSSNYISRDVVSTTKEGYKYSTPKYTFTLPPFSKKNTFNTIKPTYITPQIRTSQVPYVPVVVTTQRPPYISQTTKQNTGYDYPTPKVPFTFPSYTKQPSFPTVSISTVAPPTRSTTSNPLSQSSIILPVYITTKKPSFIPSIKIEKSTPAPFSKATGYDYPTPKVPFTFPPPQKPSTPRPTFIPPVVITTKQPPLLPSYIPPSISSTKVPSTSYRPIITSSVSPKVTGYEYPSPKNPFTLPPVTSPKPIYIASSTYIPTAISTTTTRPTSYVPIIISSQPTSKPSYLPPLIVTTQKPAFTPSSLKVTGYDYPKPKVPFTFPPQIPSKPTSPPSYIPPVTSTKFQPPPLKVTTSRPTYIPPTASTTPKPSPIGYDYPKPEIPFNLPSPSTRPPPTSPPTYLPPVNTRPPSENDGYYYPKPAIPFNF